jgi:hypothetical protein
MLVRGLKIGSNIVHYSPMAKIRLILALFFCTQVGRSNLLDNSKFYLYNNVLGVAGVMFAILNGVMPEGGRYDYAVRSL